MALIEKRKKARNEGGYTRLFGNQRLGQLLSKVHGTVISCGNELERFVLDRAKVIADLDNFLDMDVIPEGVVVAPKKVLKKSNRINYAGVQPDFVVFERKGRKHHCYIIELKDGDAFDTKKSAGERDTLHRFMIAISPHIQFSTSIHVCFFYTETRERVVEGFKRKITLNEAMTGREFCNLLGIDYDEIVEKRKEHQERNFDYFLDELLQIDAIQRGLEVRLGRLLTEKLPGGEFVSWED